MTTHKSGFVNIVGHPNVGKSTLLNALVGERMSIITHKPQTTRHRIIGLLSGDDFQIVFSDTPGFVRQPNYRMHKAMNSFVASTFDDADVMLFVTEVNDKYEEDDELLRRLGNTEAPIMLLINKIDQSESAQVEALIAFWQSKLKIATVYKISALHQRGTAEMLKALVDQLPEGPAYYPKDQITDRPERFFATEIIREKILLQYKEEVPYACEVALEGFEDTKTNAGADISNIRAVIFVERETQKPILIGKNGDAIKKLGTAARLDLEKFLQRKVFLELNVKVRENWRDDEKQLRYFGYS